MFKTKCFPVIYLKRGVLLVVILLTAIQETLSFCSVYADISLGNDNDLNYSDEAFLSEEFSVMSLNILSENASERIEYVNRFVAEYAPDILGLQEASLDFEPLFELLDNITETPYSLSSRYVSKDGIEVNTAPILYSADRFEVLSSPSANGVYRYENGNEYSVLSWIVLKEKTSKSSILVLNTQFSENDTVSNAKACISVCQRIYNELGHLPTILLGDMRITQNDLAFRYLLDAFEDSASECNQIYSSYNDNFQSGGLPSAENYPTDHIMLSKGDWNISSYSVIRNELTLKASEHYPVTVKLRLNAAHLSEYNYGSLKIINAFKLAADNKVFDRIEILNDSDVDIDLYYYRLFYISSTSKESLLEVDAENVTQNMRLSPSRGKYVLPSGKTAIIWIVLSEYYTYNTPLIIPDKEGNAVYQVNVWKELYKERFNKTIPDDALIVPLDMTSASYFKNGKTSTLKNSFCLDKDKHEMLYLTTDQSLTVKDALSAFYLPSEPNETSASETTVIYPRPSETYPSTPNTTPQGTTNLHVTAKPNDTALPPTISSYTEESATPTDPSTKEHNFPDVSGIQRLPQRDGGLSLASLLIILSSALVAVCLISLFILLIRYDKKYKRK